jgi:hypothetical protein
VEVFVEHFHEIMNRLEITQIVIIHVHTDAEIQASVAAIDDFEVAKLKWKVFLMLVNCNAFERRGGKEVT